MAIVVVAVAFGGRNDGLPINPKTASIRVKDATQMRGIHQSFIVFARESNGVFPTPGLIKRKPFNGQNAPGRGDEDVSQNTTASLFSALIMQNYFSPELVVSPAERNPNVRTMDHGDDQYDYMIYNVVAGIYWDPNFKADLKQRSHVSYAHMPIAGERKRTQWRDTLDSNFSVIANRGPSEGLMNHTSITCGPHGNWAGNVIRHDNASLFFDSTLWERVDHTGETVKDNIFAAEHELDVVLAFTRQMTDAGPTLQYD